MQLVRFEVDGAARCGVESVAGFLDAHRVLPRIAEQVAPGDMQGLLTHSETVLAALRASLEAPPRAALVPFAVARRLAPIANPPKIICAWVNYPNPATKKMPEIPIFFSKYASAIIGPGQAILLPRVASQIVVEPELTAVIGRGGRHIAESAALDHVAGYTIVNDLTAFSHRLQVLLGAPGPYMMAKTIDSFAPMGPVIVTRDEIADPHALKIRHWTNEALQVDSSSARAVFKLPQLISYLSGFFTLQPGDLITTGSPPPDGELSFLKPGDRVRIEIERIGVLENPVQAEPDPAVAGTAAGRAAIVTAA